MGKRKRDKDKEKDENYIWKKIRKLQEKLRDIPRRNNDETSEDYTPPRTAFSSPPLPPPPSSSSALEPTPLSFPLNPTIPTRPQPLSPSSSPHRPRPQDNDLDLNAEATDEVLPEEFLLALGTEGQEKTEVGHPIRSELAARWKKIMNEGLGKDARESILKKYPTPANFPAAIAPVINPEILATLSEPSIKRDKRIAIRQNLTGTLMCCLGQSLTNILKGNINTKVLIEEINDAAKLAAEIHHQDSSSRKFFCLAGANKTIQDAVRQQPIDKFLFGEDCAEKIKAAQTIQKTIKTTDKEKKQPKQGTTNKFKQLNWKGPPQFDQQFPRNRGGQQHHQPRKHYNQPHRKERHTSYKTKPRYHR